MSSTSPSQPPISLLTQPLTLPCGVTLKNRMVKSCMSDSLGNGQGQPTETQIRLYERWAQGGVSLSCVGEVQIDPRYPEKPGNLVARNNALTEPSSASTAGFQELTRRATISDAHIWAQLGHAGALTHAAVNPNPKGPSELDVPPDLHCQAMTLAEIQALPQAYAQAAVTIASYGFTGCLLHTGHGFLLSQWLSPLFNKRTDRYGGTIQQRCRLILEILQAIREAVGPSFPIGIRINSSDQLQGGLTEDEALQVIQLLEETSVDLIDVSGGTYFPGAKSASDNATKSTTDPYFLSFCRKARPLTTKPLMLTGGIKKRSQALHALASGAVDMVGIARALAMNANLASDWSKEEEKAGTGETGVDPIFPRFEKTVPGGVTAWYTMRLTALGEDAEDNFDMDLPTALETYDNRDAARATLWKKHFQLPSQWQYK